MYNMSPLKTQLGQYVLRNHVMKPVQINKQINGHCLL